MNKVIYSLAVAIVLFACNNEPAPKASTDLVSNPASADSNVTKTELQKGVAKIEFEKMEHDFGNITQGEQTEYSFKFKNTGDGDLIVSAATASCGCTVPEFSKEPIKPGGQGLIKVKFNSEYRLDGFEKGVVITANTSPLETVLKIKGFINPKPGGETPNLGQPQKPH
jgi:hypothetical protein